MKELSDTKKTRKPILKVIFISLIAVAFLCAALLFFLVADDSVDRWIYSQMKAELESRFPVQFESKDFEVDFFQTRVSLAELEIRQFRDNIADPVPQVQVDSLELDFSLVGLISPEISIDSLRIIRPIIRSSHQQDGSLDIVSMFSPSSSGDQEQKSKSPFRINIGDVDIEQASILYENSQMDLNIAGEGLQGSLEGSGEELLTGDLHIREFELRLGDQEFPASRIRLDWQYDRSGFRVQSGNLENRQFSLLLQGNYDSIQQELDFGFDLTLRSDEEGLIPFQKSGDLVLKGRVRGDPWNPVFTGSASSDDLVLDRYQISDLAFEFEGTREIIDINRGKSRFCSGDIDFDGRVSTGESDSRFDIRAQDLKAGMCNIDVTRFSPYEGLFSLEAVLQWPGLGIREYQLTGATEFYAFLKNSKEIRDFDLRGKSRFSSSKGVIRLSRTQISSDWIEVSSEGFYRPAEQRFQISGQSSVESAGKILQFLYQLEILTPAVVESYRLEPSGELGLVFEIDFSPSDWQVSSSFELDQTKVNQVALGSLEGNLLWDEGNLSLDQLLWINSDQELQTTIEWERQDTGLQLTRMEIGTRNVPLQAAAFLLTEEAISGSLSGDFRYRPSASSTPAGSGKVRLQNLTWRNERIDQLESEISFSGSEVDADQIRASLFDGEIEGNLKVDLESNDYQGRILADAISLEKIHTLNKRTPVNGRIDFVLEGSGNLDSPKFRLNLEGPEIIIQDKPFQEVTLSSYSDGDQMVLDLEASFLNHPLKLAGRVGLGAPFPFSSRLLFEQLAYDQYLAFFLPEQPLSWLSGYASGTIEAEGEISPFQLSSLRANLNDLAVDINESRLRMRESDAIVLESDTIRLNNLELEGNNTALKVDGTVELGTGNQLDLKLEGSLNLDLLNGFIEEGAVRGQAEIDTRLAGTLDNPTIVGNANLKAVSLVHSTIPFDVLEANGGLAFTANQISVEDVSLLTQYGQVTLEGGVFLENLEPNRWQLNATGSGLSVEFPTDVNNVIDIDLDLIRSNVSQLIAGTVYVRSSEYDQRITVPELILNLTRKDRPEPESVQAETILLDIDVEAVQTLRINNNLADITASGDFQITGTLGKPIILGSLNVQQGRVFFGTNTYDLEQGTVTFGDPNETRPYFNFELSTEVRDYTVGVLLRGSVEQPQLTVRSDPPLPTGSIISLIASGQTNEQLFGRAGSDTGTLAFYGATTVLGKTVEEAVKSQTSDLFGFEKFSIDPFITSSSGRNPGARVTLGKQITSDLNITYITSLGGEFTTQVVVVQYRLTDWLTTVGTREEDGSISLDFKFRKRF